METQSPALAPPPDTWQPPRNKKTGKGLVVIAILAVVILGGMLLAGYLPRIKQSQELSTASQVQRDYVPEVRVALVKRGSGTSELELPGNIQALTESPIYSRADGYLKQRLVDIGDRVKEGQLLAVVDSPELEQQLHQAKSTVLQSQAALTQAQAALQQAISNQHLAEVTLNRWQTLVGKGVLSKQEGDEKQAAYDARSADVNSAKANIEAAKNVVQGNEANVRRITELAAYQRITAPFAGLITARNVDVGALITSNGTTGRELYRLAQMNTLRIYVNVPQTNIGSIQVGMPALVTVQQLPARKFTGRIARTSDNLDAATRTLLTEVQVPNQNGLLLPGMYAQVHLEGTTANPGLLIPGDSLLARPDGIEVATVTPEGKVHFKRVTVGRDFGAESEIITGLDGTEKVIDNPSDEVKEGTTVKPVLRSPTPVRH